LVHNTRKDSSTQLQMNHSQTNCIIHKRNIAFLVQAKTHNTRDFQQEISNKAITDASLYLRYTCGHEPEPPCLHRANLGEALSHLPNYERERKRLAVVRGVSVAPHILGSTPRESELISQKLKVFVLSVVDDIPVDGKAPMVTLSILRICRSSL
jgi:hypothetical protein